MKTKTLVVAILAISLCGPVVLAQSNSLFARPAAASHGNGAGDDAAAGSSNNGSASNGSAQGGAAADPNAHHAAPGAPTSARAPAAQPAATAQSANSPLAVATLRPDATSVRGSQHNIVLQMYSPIAVAPPEPKVLRAGDFVTIIVREDKTATSDEKLQSDKDWNVTSEFKKWFRLNPEDHLVGQQFKQPTPGIDFDFQSQYSGKGKYDRTDSLAFRVTVRVLDVKPNGTLVLEGRKEITDSEDGYTATITGECRAADITPQNTILSTQLYDLKVKVDNHGAARDAARRGWLKKAVDFLRPI